MKKVSSPSLLNRIRKWCKSQIEWETSNIVCRLQVLQNEKKTFLTHSSPETQNHLSRLLLQSFIRIG